MDQQLKTGKNHTIGLLRGIVSLSVCLYHFAYGTLISTNDNFLSPLLVLNPFRWHLFFLISGYIVPTAMVKHRYIIQGYLPFLFRRWTRLAPAAYIAMLLMILLQLASISFKGNPISGIVFPGLKWNDLIGNLVFHPIIFDTQWYYSIFVALQIEFQFYLLIGLVLPWIITSRHRAIGFILGCLAVKYLFEWIPWGDFPLATVLTYFMMGMILFQYFERNFTRLEMVILNGLSLILCAYIEGFDKALSCLVVIGLLLYSPNLIVKPLNQLGEISYSLFLLHIPVGIMCDFILKNYFPSDSTWVKTIHLFLILTIVIVVSFFFHQWVEKRFMKLSTKIRY